MRYYIWNIGVYIDWYHLRLVQLYVACTTKEVKKTMTLYFGRTLNLLAMRRVILSGINLRQRQNEAHPGYNR